MNINIPMNTSGTVSLGSLGGSGLGGAVANTGMPGAMQGNMGTPGAMSSNMGTPNAVQSNMGTPGAMQGNTGMPGTMQSGMGAVQSNMGTPNQMQGNIGAMQSNMGTPQTGTVKQRPQGNGVHLKKGQKVNLAQPGSALQSIQVCLGWDVLNQSCDLDASAFMLDPSNRVIGDDWFVFYGQTVSPDGSVRHSGDSQGQGAGDDEVITINFTQINPSVKKIVFVVTINEALERGLNFSMVANAYVRVVDTATGSELVRFSLTDYYANVTSMVVGEVYNHNGQWKFNAVGDGVAKDLAGLCAMYGVNVAD